MAEQLPSPCPNCGTPYRQDIAPRCPACHAGKDGSPEAALTKVCSNCIKEVDDRAMICPYCRSTFVDSQGYKEFQERESKEWSSACLVWVVLFGVIVAIAAAFGYFNQ